MAVEQTVRLNRIWEQDARRDRSGLDTGALCGAVAAGVWAYEPFVGVAHTSHSISVEGVDERGGGGLHKRRSVGQLHVGSAEWREASRRAVATVNEARTCGSKKRSSRLS